MHCHSRAAMHSLIDFVKGFVLSEEVCKTCMYAYAVPPRLLSHAAPQTVHRACTRLL